jgi:tetratricopeptide (TPR) repeat protein
LTSAQVDLAYLCSVQAIYGFMSPAVAAQNIRRAAQAIPQSSSHAEAVLPALGWTSFHLDRDLNAALDAFSRSENLPHESRVSRLRVMFALSRHRFDEAIDLMRGALQEDPFSPLLQARMGWALHLAGCADESMEQIRRAFSLFPNYEWTSLYGAIIACANGESEWGLKLAEELAQRHPYFDLATAVHAYALASNEHRNEARAVLDRLQWLSRERFVARSFTASVYVALGDHKSALGELEAANESRCPWFFQMLADPRLKPLDPYPEFAVMKSALAEMETETALQY